jgi:hypothetical protein
MKLISALLVLLCVAPTHGQSAADLLRQGKVTGRVLDKDGMTPLQGAEIQIEELSPTNNGQVQVRGSHTVKTGSDGRYSLSGLYAGRVRLGLLINAQRVIVKGEKIGDEVWVSPGLVLTVDFDLSKSSATATTAKPSN